MAVTQADQGSVDDLPEVTIACVRALRSLGSGSMSPATRISPVVSARGSREVTCRIPA